VTILPTGMALGVTQQLPIEERHIHPRIYIEDSLCVRMGGRVAELLVYGDLSTGAANDLVGNTELARKMVREWGMSDEIGPMAWGSQGQVFLGEDLMHTRDYSEDTSRVIDDEVERILREQEERAVEVLSKHRDGLEAVAKTLLSKRRSTAWPSGASSTRHSASRSTPVAPSPSRTSTARARTATATAPAPPMATAPRHRWVRGRPRPPLPLRRRAVGHRCTW